MQFQKGNRARLETKIFPYVMTYNNVQKRLIWNSWYIHSWSGVGALYGISRALAFQVAMNNYEPKNPILRQKSFPLRSVYWLLLDRRGGTLPISKAHN